MHEYSVKKQENDTYTLNKDGNISLCPMNLVTIPVQGKMGQVGLMPTQMPCSTICPFANIEKVKNFKEQETGGSIIDEKQPEKYQYVISCAARERRIDLPGLEPAQPKPKLTVIMPPAAEA